MPYRYRVSRLRSVILNKSLKTSPTGYIPTRNVIRLLEQTQNIGPEGEVSNSSNAKSRL